VKRIATKFRCGVREDWVIKILTPHVVRKSPLRGSRGGGGDQMIGNKGLPLDYKAVVEMPLGAGQ